MGRIGHPIEEETWMIALHEFDHGRRLTCPAATGVLVA